MRVPKNLNFIYIQKKQRPQRIVLTVVAAEQTCKYEKSTGRPATCVPVCNEPESIAEKGHAVMEH